MIKLTIVRIIIIPMLPLKTALEIRDESKTAVIIAVGIDFFIKPNKRDMTPILKTNVNIIKVKKNAIFSDWIENVSVIIGINLSLVTKTERDKIMLIK